MTSPNDASNAAVKPRFSGGTEFYTELKRRVSEFFADGKRRERDCLRMYLKTAIILGGFVGTYLLLILWASTWWQIVPLVALLAVGIAAIGFNIQHDGGHQAYSDSAIVNRLMAWTMDLAGASSYIWHRKHDIIHHTYTNIPGHDSDIELGVFGRLSPEQPRRAFHRYQHFYLWFLYGLMAIKWQLVDDFRDVIKGRIGNTKIQRPRGWALFGFLLGKVVFFSWAFAIPLMLHTWWVVLLCYIGGAGLLGVILSVTFQLAHCVEEADFPTPDKETGQVGRAWAEHQLATTVNFAPRNWLCTWFMGGLNFQVEHHLFAKICHVNYPALSRVVEETCKDFGVPYNTNGSLWRGIVSHYRFLRRMGRA